MKLSLQAYRGYCRMYVNHGPRGHIFAPSLRPKRAKIGPRDQLGPGEKAEWNQICPGHILETTEPIFMIPKL